MRRAQLIFFIVIALAPAVRGSADVHSKIRLALADRNYSILISDLEQLRSSDPAGFELNNYPYLLARIYECNGEHAKAVSAYQRVIASASVLREYALWRISQMARFAGDPFLERLYLYELLSAYPDGLLAEAARGRTAQSYITAGNYRDAIRTLSATAGVAIGPYSPLTSLTDPLARSNLALLAKALYLSGENERARSIFEKLVAETPNPQQPDDLALEGVRGLDEMEGGEIAAARSVPKLPPEEHFRRAGVYQFNRIFDVARLHYLAIVHEYSDHTRAASSAFQIGRGLVQRENYAEAIPWFERVLEQFPEDPIAKDALLQAGSGYTRIGKHREAISRYRQYIDRYPNDERVDRAYLNIIDIARDSGEETQALRQAASAQDVFRGKVGEAQALFAEGRIHLAAENWELALGSMKKLATIPDLGGARVPGGTSRNEAAFLAGFSLEQLQRFEEAIDTYLSIKDGRNEYYGWRATERLRGLAKQESAKAAVVAKLRSLEPLTSAADANVRKDALHAQFRLTADVEARSLILEKITSAYAQIPEYRDLPAFSEVTVGRTEYLEKARNTTTKDRHKAIADELLFLGLYDEAAPELEATGLENIPGGEFNLAAIYARGDIAHRGAGFLEPLWRSVPADLQIEAMPEQSVRLLYPTPFSTSIENAAAARSVDPRFLLAVMRQESRYRPDVKSNAAARGLMQFIPQTSEQIARELGLIGFRQDDLYDPATAVLFGSQYVANLLRLFPNQPDAAASAYNGGEDNTMRWKKRSGSELPERYVPEIAFAQTKDYVFNVMAAYRVYSAFYGQDLKPLPR